MADTQIPYDNVPLLPCAVQSGLRILEMERKKWAGGNISYWMGEFAFGISVSDI